LRIAILGSCVTRDAFGFHREVLGRPEQYFARSGLASAMCAEPFRGVDTSTIASDFQRGVVDMDLEGTFAAWLPTGEFDVLILDVIDERFSLLIDADGAIATRSVEFTSAIADTSRCRVVPPHTDEYFDLWQSAWVRFLAVVDEIGARDRIRINRVRWADTFDGPGVRFPKAYSQAAIVQANAFLDRLYRRIELDLTPEQFYRYSEHELRAAAEHQWGLAPFHYTPAFYRRFVQHVTGVEIPAPEVVSDTGVRQGLWTRLRGGRSRPRS
jgi:hypothetical protein